MELFDLIVFLVSGPLGVAMFFLAFVFLGRK